MRCTTLFANTAFGFLSKVFVFYQSRESEIRNDMPALDSNRKQVAASFGKSGIQGQWFTFRLSIQIVAT